MTKTTSKIARVALRSTGLVQASGTPADDIPPNQCWVTLHATTPAGEATTIRVHFHTVLRYKELMGDYQGAWRLLCAWTHDQMVGTSRAHKGWTHIFEELADTLYELGCFPPSLRKRVNAPSGKIGPAIRPLCPALAAEMAPWVTKKGGLRRQKLFGSVVQGPDRIACRLTGREPRWLQNPAVPKFCSFRSSVPPHIRAWLRDLYGIHSALYTSQH